MKIVYVCKVNLQKCKVFLQRMKEVLRITFRKTRSYRHWHGSGNLRI